MKITIATISSLLMIMVCCLLSCQHSRNSLEAHEGQMWVKAIPFHTASGWGYEIYANDTLYIRQAFIPSLPGRHSFQSKDDALKTAQLAIQKMAILHTMPYISQQDLRQLHVQIPD